MTRPHSPPRRDRLGLAALMIAIAVVLARCCMLESVRDPFAVTPGSTATARGAGVAASLVLDLICCVPALVVLLGRIINKQPLRRASLACGLAGLLAVWTAMSIAWADDQFAAAVGGAHVVAAAAMLWAAAQLVSSWSRLRLVAAMVHGLLLIYIVQAVYYRYSEWPATLESFEKNKATFLKQQGWKADDFLARQFEIKLRSGEMVFFHGSANSFAAVLVLLMGVSAGLAIDRLAAKQYLLAGAAAIALPAAGWVVYLTQSKAALVTPALIAGILALRWWKPGAITFWRGLTVVVLALAGLVALGLMRHGLPGASLNFRWRYWTAAWHMFVARPWLGVGWENFNLHYLQFRLPVAAEEIQDPHNFLVRWATELGIVGLAIGGAYIGRLWWELSRRTTAIADGMALNIEIVSAIAAAAILINIFAAVDFSMVGSFVALELVKRALFGCVLVLGASVAGMNFLASPQIDDRPAPWLAAATGASLGAFLIHNLIEFSFFEAGPMMLFALLAGSAVGLRRPASAPQPGTAAVKLGLAALAGGIALAALVIPVIRAEGLAREGDEFLRAGVFDQASADYAKAFGEVDFNADYADRAAQALTYKPQRDRSAAIKLLDAAIAANPSAVPYYLSRGRMEYAAGEGDLSKADFARALALDPNEVSIRLEYAALLKQLGLGDEADKQYELAEKYNRLLQPDEPKRLTEKQMEEARPR